MSVITLEEESDRLTELLKRKVVKLCARHETGELVIIFKDGTRLFVSAESELELSVTGG